MFKRIVHVFVFTLQYARHLLIEYSRLQHKRRRAVEQYLLVEYQVDDNNFACAVSPCLVGGFDLSTSCNAPAIAINNLPVGVFTVVKPVMNDTAWQASMTHGKKQS